MRTWIKDWSVILWDAAEFGSREQMYDRVFQLNKALAPFRENEARHPIDDNVVSIARNAQRTSKRVAKKVIPHTGSIRRRVFDRVAEAKEYGATDAELEILLNGKHQTISASRRSLVRDGWIKDSGKTRKNDQSNDCIVWVNKHEKFTGVLFEMYENA